MKTRIGTRTIIAASLAANALLLVGLLWSRGIGERAFDLDNTATAATSPAATAGTSSSTAKAAGLPADPAPGARGSATQRRTELTEAARIVSPAIVSVGVNQTQYMLSPESSYFSEYIGVYPYQEKIPYVGSGVIIDTKGLVVTNYHVVERQQDVFVTLTDGREFHGKVLDADTLLDVALIKLDNVTGNLPAARLGDSDDLLVGEWVMAMGNPFGNVIGDPNPTVTAGVVSAVHRSFRPSGGLQRPFFDMIQTDAAINPGNSGGALINSIGDVIGINTFILSKSGGAEGVGFAIPSNRVKGVVQEILAYGRVRPRLMDFQVQNLTDRIARQVGAKVTKGAVISELRNGGPAARGGLRVGDVITALNGRPILDAQGFTLGMWTQQVGTKFKFTIDREGKSVDVEYTLEEGRT